MKHELQLLLKTIIADMGVTDVVPDVTISDDSRNGEYTTNIAMRLASAKGRPASGRKQSPMDIALQVKEGIDARKSRVRHDNPYQKIHQVSQKHADIEQERNILQDIDRVEVAAPGFCNFFLTEASLSSRIQEVPKDGERYGTVPFEGKKQPTVMVEYTDPNPFKEFHIGHLYSNAVGESIARLHEAIGWNVIRVDYFGDVGMHVAKSIWGLQRKMNEDGFTLRDLEKLSLPERVQYLGQAYAKGATIYEEKIPEADAAKEEMKDINFMVYLAAQEYMQKTLKWEPQVDYRQHVNVEDGTYQKVKLMFETGRAWSMEYFETIFRRLGTHFDDYYPESMVGEYGAKLVREYMGNVFEESDGAVVFRGTHTRVFLNSLGLPTYEAKELGLNWKKSQDYHLDTSYIVTGNEINEYFKVVLSAMSRVVPEAAQKTRHIGHGMVRLPEGKMSSRTGNVISGVWLLDEVKKSIYAILEQNESKYTKKEKEDIAEKAAIAAIKYSMLRVALPANIAFDFDTSLSFDGDSGPYLLYTYARCQSVLRKASEQPSGVQGQALKSRPGLVEMNPEEKHLARVIFFFPEIVVQAAESLSPNALCSYLFKLAQAFNLFYQKHPILQSSVFSRQSSDRSDGRKLIADSSFRLTLTAATAQVLKNGLHVLGIETVERM